MDTEGKRLETREIYRETTHAVRKGILGTTPTAKFVAKGIRKGAENRRDVEAGGGTTEADADNELVGIAARSRGGVSVADSSGVRKAAKSGPGNDYRAYSLPMMLILIKVERRKIDRSRLGAVRRNLRARGFRPALLAVLTDRTVLPSPCRQGKHGEEASHPGMGKERRGEETATRA